jgi:hypothetical protein
VRFARLPKQGGALRGRRTGWWLWPSRRRRGLPSSRRKQSGGVVRRLPSPSGLLPISSRLTSRCTWQTSAKRPRRRSARLHRMRLSPRLWTPSSAPSGRKQQSQFLKTKIKEEKTRIRLENSAKPVQSYRQRPVRMYRCNTVQKADVLREAVCYNEGAACAVIVHGNQRNRRGGDECQH